MTRNWRNYQHKNRPIPERFWEKVNICGDDECWNWLAYKDQNNSGTFEIGRRSYLAHRVAWELTNGNIPKGLNLLHKCDNKLCCNPKHLFLRTTTEYFWSKVDIRGKDECWNWTAGKLPTGYGLFYRKGHSKFTHRIAWEFVNGIIPDGMLVCHHCDNPACCNPAHLFLGTDFDNMSDMIKKGRDRHLKGVDGRFIRVAYEVP